MKTVNKIVALMVLGGLSVTTVSAHRYYESDSYEEGYNDGYYDSNGRWYPREGRPIRNTVEAVADIPGDVVGGIFGR